MEDIDRIIGAETIARLADRLYAELDPERHRVLRQTLLTEEDRYGGRSEQLEIVTQHIAEISQRIDKHYTAIQEQQSRGWDIGENNRALINLIEIRKQYEVFRSHLLNSLERTETQLSSGARWHQIGEYEAGLRQAPSGSGAERSARLILERAPNAMIMIGRSGVMIMVNVEAERIFGYARNELLGRSVEMLLPERFREAHAGMRSGYFAELRPRAMGAGRDLYGLRKDGREFPVEIGLNPIETEDGTMVLASVIDITERKRAASELRESEERFRVMADTAPVMVWMSGTDKLCTWFNKPWLDFVGRPIEQELGDGWAENIHPEDYGRCLEIYSSAFDAREPFSMEYRLRRFDGEYRWMLDNGIAFHRVGEFAGYIGSCIDITERKAAETALRDSEHQFRSLAAIVASSDDAIISTTLDGVVTSWNRAAERVFGYAEAEMIGQPIVNLAAPGYQAEMLEILGRIRRGDRVRHFETMRRHKNGALLHVSLTESPIYDADGRLIGASKVLRDITAAKTAEAALQKSEARLQELHSELLHVSRLSAMGQMAAMLAHELNQPLTAISNYMEAAGVLLGRGGAAPAEQLRSVVERAGQQAVRAGQIIQRLRGFVSRGDTKKRVEALPEVIREARELALVGTKQRDVKIRLGEQLPDVFVLVDRIQVQQVLLNLLRNAAEAVASQEQREISLLAEEKEGMVEIAVADNGPGLPAEIRARLFQPFVSTKPTGMGVGLSICHSIVASHNGRLWAEENPAGGTIFRFTLPLVPAETE